jgi:hypothetical protein
MPISLLESHCWNLIVGIKWLLGICTMRFNRRQRLAGHLLPANARRLRALFKTNDRPRVRLQISIQ